jgi:hypothetical protein
MTRSIGLSGLPDEQNVTLDVAEVIDSVVQPTVRVTHRVPLRLRYAWQGLPALDDLEDPGEDAGGDEGGGVIEVPINDPGNPVDHTAADFIGPSGSKVPDLAAIHVTTSRKSGPAPLGVTFQLRSADPNFWAFNMFGTAEWTFSADPLENYAFRYLDGDMAGETAGTAQGPYVSHTYVRPGAHAWSVTLRYPGLAPRTISNTGYLLTRADLPPYLHRTGTDVPAWLGMTKGSRAYAMSAVATGGRINVTLTNGHGTQVLRNIALADGATADQVANAIAAAANKDTAGTQVVEARLAGIDFTASGSTLTANSSCPLGVTTIAIGPGDAAGVTWEGGVAPDFSAPAPAGIGDVRYTLRGVTTGGAITLSFANEAGTVDLGAICVPSGATAWQVCHEIIQRMEMHKDALSAIGIGNGVRNTRLVYLSTGVTQLRLSTAKALTPTTITLGVPATPAGVTWSGGAPDMAATVPAATGAAVTTITVEDPETFFAGRTVYCSPAYPDGLALKAAAASLGIPATLANDRYYGGPECFYEASQARDNATGKPWRILLHAGQEYVFADGGRRPGTVNTYVGRFGTGANPKITITDTFRQSALMNYQDSGQKGWGTFADLDFIGLYDSANPPYSASWMCNLFQLNSQNNYGLTIHGCLMQGWRTNVSIPGVGVMALVVSDTRMTSWFDFGMYPNATHATGFAGLAIKQKIGTVNAGRRSTAQGDVGDRYKFPAAADYTSLFSWALEPAGGPKPKTGAPAVPPGYGAPATGAWREHPGGTEAWAWWKANWESFTWVAANKNAWVAADNDLVRDCAVHGPVRLSTPSYQTGWHQCEFRSLNGWSRSQLYDATKPDLEQRDNAYAIQPCFRMNTAMGSNGPSQGHSTSMWACAMEGGGSGLVAVPEQNFQPTIDTYSIGPGMVLDRMIFRALDGAVTAFSAKYGRCMLRNSVAIFAGTAVRPQNLVLFGGTENTEPAGSAYNYSYNNTTIFARDLMAVQPSTKFGFARTNDREVGKRGLVEWNNLTLRYAPIRNSSEYPDPAIYAPLADVAGLGYAHAPQAGSSALATAVAPVPHGDGAGTVRPTAAAVGAAERVD